MKVESIGSNMTQVSIDSLKILVSYETPVAYYEIDTDTAFRTNRKWSATTSRHISKWLGIIGKLHAVEVNQEQIDSLL